MRRIILIIIDSLGIGAMDDVYINRSQDIGANTLKSLMNYSDCLNIPNLLKIGIINALGIESEVFKFEKDADVTYGSAKLGYSGADSYLGHMEMFGYNLSSIEMEPISKNIKVIADRIEELGYKVEVKGSKLKYIVVNECIFIGDNIEAEAGSVYSVIGYNGSMDFSEIKQISLEIRKLVRVPRIVAVSSNMTISELEGYIEDDDKYIGINSEKCSLYNKEYKVEHIPYALNNQNTLTEYLHDRNIKTSLIGKVADIIPDDRFNKKKLVKNEEIFSEIKKTVSYDDSRFIVANFQECDLSGHLNSIEGYVTKLNEIDAYIGWILNNLKENDMLMITADHGNDPAIGHRYHTRERVPVLVHNNDVYKGYIGNFDSLVIISEIIKESFRH